jgi:hypothetical protein
MKHVILLAAGLAVASAVPASAAGDKLYHDAGMLLGVRSYALAAMVYCGDKLGSAGQYQAAADAWSQRNADDSAALDVVIDALDVDTATQAQMDQMVADQINADVAQVGDAASFCEQTLAFMNAGRRDMAAMAADAMANVRSAASH